PAALPIARGTRDSSERRKRAARVRAWGFTTRRTSPPAAPAPPSPPSSPAPDEAGAANAADDEPSDGPRKRQPAKRKSPGAKGRGRSSPVRKAVSTDPVPASTVPSTGR